MTEEKAEGDEAKETTHKTHNPEGIQSTANVTMGTSLQLYCIIPGREGWKKKNRSRNTAATAKTGKIAHETHEQKGESSSKKQVQEERFPNNKNRQETKEEKKVE